MVISIKKFGITLISRSAGKEAWLAFQPILRTIDEHEKIQVDFEGIAAMGPSWADEFLTPMAKKYAGRIEWINMQNPSVKATLEILELV